MGSSANGNTVACNAITRGLRNVTVGLKRNSLSLEDLRNAESAITQYCQQQRFKQQFEALSKGTSVSRLSSIYRLDAVLKDGLLRVGGRLHKSAMPEEAKHPIILAKDQHISDWILKYIHQSLGHSGRAHTLSAARRRFWIAKGNSAVRKIIRECSFCRRYCCVP